MIYTYYPQGTCSRQIDLDIADDGTVNEVRFIGGCAGNTSGLCSLVKGMKADEVARRLHGILCGSKGTSCPDQLASALEKIMADIASRTA